MGPIIKHRKVSWITFLLLNHGLLFNQIRYLASLITNIFSCCWIRVLF